MTKICSNCEETKEKSEFRGTKKVCKDCSGSQVSLSINAKNFKWRVPIETCKNGHAHVPIKGKCGKCEPVIMDAKGCEQCKRSMVGLGNRRFCSTACSQAHTVGILTDRECKHCEARLTIKQEKFCSNPCALAYTRNIRRLLNTPMI